MDITYFQDGNRTCYPLHMYSIQLYEAELHQKLSHTYHIPLNHKKQLRIPRRRMRKRSPTKRIWNNVKPFIPSFMDKLQAMGAMKETETPAQEIS